MPNKDLDWLIRTYMEGDMTSQQFKYFLRSLVLQALPEEGDLDSPLQQSWKLGGTDEGSFRKGHRYALSEAEANIRKVLG